METALLSLFSLVFFVFAFGIALFVLALRSVVEAVFKKIDPILPDKVDGFLIDVWREWIMPAAPIIVGGLLAFFLTGYPYPADFAVSASGRVFFGLIAGFFSSSIYRFAKYHIKKYLPEEVKNKVDGIARSLKSPGSKEE